ncbi:MAG TPA: hypothetical protein VKH35_00550, partial [Thermoanaerobaculia bacterium]|nr:hypothetical protein [Thermoanaerobaculia bacterium]
EEVIAQIEGARHAVPDIGPEDRERSAIGDLFRRLSDARRESLNRLSVGQMVRELYSPRAPSRIEDRRGPVGLT